MTAISLRVLSLVAVLVMSSAPATGQSGYTLGYHTYQGRTYPYYIFVPANLDPLSRYPLVLCMHGLLGEAVKPLDVAKAFGYILADSAKQSKWPSFFLVPFNNPWNSGFAAAANDLLDTLLGQFPINPGRLCLTGISMGGGESWDLLVQHPNKFAAAVLVSATGGDTSKASLLRHIPLWVFHGALDMTVYVSNARQMISALERRGVTAVYTEALPDSVVEDRIQSGARLLYTEYPDGTHDIGARAYTEPLLLPWVFLQQVTAGMEEHQLRSVPMEHSLSQNYPNPFNPTTRIQFTIVNRQLTIVNVFDMLGREVTTLINEIKSPGTYTVEFDGSNLASGVYFYRLQAGDVTLTKRLLLLR
jgi:pimeloyl-ACP methyl ester carboxylesterase